jgi:hypothetical protein
MPARVNPADRNVLIVAGGVGLVLVVIAALLTSSGNVESVPTTYSVGSGGARAAYLLLGAAGVPVERWERSVRDLPSGAKTTLILAEPQGIPSAAERAAVARFIEGGGRVIATGLAGALFLPQQAVGPDPVAGLTWARLESRAPSFITRAAPAITLAPAAYWDANVFAVPLYGDSRVPGAVDHDSKLRVVEYNAGAGDVVWWASATPLTNAGIREPGNLEFLVACLGPTPERVLWDESFHGHGPSASVSVIDSPFTWVGLQLALIAVAILLTYARRSGPVVPTPTDNRLSPLEFVRTLGSLYGRAGAASVAVDVAYQRLRYQLTRHLGAPGDTSVDDLEHAIRSRWQLVDPTVGTLLRQCESARHDTSLTAERALSLTRSLSELAARLNLVRLPDKEPA